MYQIDPFPGSIYIIESQIWDEYADNEQDAIDRVECCKFLGIKADYRIMSADEINRLKPDHNGHPFLTDRGEKHPAHPGYKSYMWKKSKNML